MTGCRLMLLTVWYLHDDHCFGRQSDGNRDRACVCIESVAPNASQHSHSLCLRQISLCMGDEGIFVMAGGQKMTQNNRGRGQVAALTRDFPNRNFNFKAQKVWR